MYPLDINRTPKVPVGASVRTLAGKSPSAPSLILKKAGREVLLLPSLRLLAAACRRQTLTSNSFTW